MQQTTGEILVTSHTDADAAAATTLESKQEEALQILQAQNCNNNDFLPPTWGQVIDFLSDEMARIKGERLTTLFCGRGMKDGIYLREPCVFGDNFSNNCEPQESSSGGSSSSSRMDSLKKQTSTDNTFGASVGIPRNVQWMEPFLCKQYSVNDEVFVKWNGQSTTTSTTTNPTTTTTTTTTCREESGNVDKYNESRYMAGWFPGRIISIQSCDQNVVLDNNELCCNDGGNGMVGATIHCTAHACIELRDEISETQWTTTQSITTIDSSLCKQSFSKNTNILGGLPFGFGLDPQTCVAAVTTMAKQLLYLDMSLPPWTQVRVLWTDGVMYDAHIMCPTEVDWGSIKRTAKKLGSKGVVGPCVPVQWDEGDSSSIVPIGWCVVMDEHRQSVDGVLIGNKLNLNCDQVASAAAAAKSAKGLAEKIHSPTDAMLASLNCTGKHLHGDLPIFDSSTSKEEECNSWEAYDAEDCEWLPIQLMNKVEPKLLPLEVLANHMCYRESGSYSVVFWENDSVLSIVPNSFLRKRSKSQEDIGGEESEEDATSMEDYSSLNTSECLLLDDVGEFNFTAKNYSLVELGTVVIVFGIGYLLGTMRSR